MRCPETWESERRRRRLAGLLQRWRDLRRVRRLAGAAAAVAECAPLVRAAAARWDGDSRTVAPLLAGLAPLLAERLAGIGRTLPALRPSPAELEVHDAARLALRDEGQRTLLAVTAVHRLARRACGDPLRGVPALELAAEVAGWDTADRLLRAAGVDERAEAERVAAAAAAGRAGWRACRRHRLERALLARVVAAAYAPAEQAPARRRLRRSRAVPAADVEVCA